MELVFGQTTRWSWNAGMELVRKRLENKEPELFMMEIYWERANPEDFLTKHWSNLIMFFKFSSL